MKYDKSNIPDTYDAGREISAEAKNFELKFFFENLSGDNVADIVDLGCGTGRFSQTLAELFDANIVGVDPSHKMLNQARNKSNSGRISFVIASAEAIPLGDGVADMVFMSMVLHHLSSPEKTALECHRVLRKGGYVCIRNTVSDEISSYPYLDCFPSIYSIIEDQLISREQLKNIFGNAGLKIVAQQTVWSEISSDWQIFTGKIALKADSFVAQLENDEFNAGLAKLRMKSKGETSNEKVGLNVDSIIFQKI